MRKLQIKEQKRRLRDEISCDNMESYIIKAEKGQRWQENSITLAYVYVFEMLFQDSLAIKHTLLLLVVPMEWCRDHIFL